MIAFLIIFIISMISILGGIISLIYGRYKKLEFVQIWGFVITLSGSLIQFFTLIFWQIPLPTIYPLDNEVTRYNPIQISIESSLPVYYTIDGTNPQSNGVLYTNPIVLDSPTTITAKCKFLWFWSKETKSYYEILSDNKTNATVEYNVPSNLNEDYKINWKDESFGNMVKSYFGKDDIYYSDLSQIYSIIIYGNYMFTTYDELYYITPENKKVFKFYGNENGFRDGLSGDEYPFGNFQTLDDLLNFSNLRSIKFEFQDNLDCSVFIKSENFENVNYLSVGFCNLDNNSVEYISNLANLKHLIIFNNNITDIAPLSKLKKIESIQVSWNNIVSVEPLAQLDKLTELDISYTKVDDISCFFNNKNLKRLTAKNTQISDFSPVEQIELILDY